MAKVKFYSVHGECTDSIGDKHTVTLVGKLEWLKESSVKIDEKNDVFKAQFIKVNKKRLTIGMAICHKLDTFDLAIGESIAKRRIKHHEDIGYIETKNFSMLTDDAVNAELLVKLAHVLKNIERYLPEKEEEFNIDDFKNEDGVYDMSNANDEDIIMAMGLLNDEDDIILPGTGSMKKSEVKNVIRDAIQSMRTNNAGQDGEANQESAPATADVQAEG